MLLCSLSMPLSAARFLEQLTLQQLLVRVVTAVSAPVPGCQSYSHACSSISTESACHHLAAVLM